MLAEMVLTSRAGPLFRVRLLTDLQMYMYHDVSEAISRVLLHIYSAKHCACSFGQICVVSKLLNTMWSPFHALMF